MWHLTFWILVIDWLLRVLFSVKVILKKRPVGISLAWLLIILIFPFVGTAIYVVLGENRLGNRRALWARRLRKQYSAWKACQTPYFHDRWSDSLSDSAQLSRMIFAASDALPLRGNRVEILASADEVFARMIADIDAAQSHCVMEYYIWEVGGAADVLSDRLAAAARRGVDCKVLVDAVGGRGFLRSKQASRLKDAGVAIHAALPVGFIRAFLYRFDLRLHRKLVVIDGQIGYAGSQNMADPKVFKNGAGFGQWIDAMVRIEGPAVDGLLMVFAEDWQFETTGILVPQLAARTTAVPGEIGPTVVQVVPSGPGLDSEAILQILINAIYSADHQLTITTPYLVPDESLQRALISATRRGVDVTVVIPQRVDSLLVRLASRPALRELVEIGVHVARYRKGMLHTKSITIDGEVSFFGSLNLDPRSLHLNFEIMLAFYDNEFTSKLMELQQEYIANSDLALPSDLQARSFPMRFAESCARLLSPLL